MKNSIKSVDLLVERKLLTKYGIWNEYLFVYANKEIVVLAYGEWQNKPELLVRVHSTCLSAHYLFSVECDCREQLEIAFKRIVKNGYGLIVLLDQDGRGNGHAALMRAAIYAKSKGCTQSEAYESLGYEDDSRSFKGAGIVLQKLGVHSVILMSNNPEKIKALQERGIVVIPKRIVVESLKKGNLSKYYKNKAREGHLVESELHKRKRIINE